MRRSARLALLSALLTAVAGCVTLPDSGPVRGSPTVPASETAAPFDYNPPGPQPGASRDVIVAGFLEALQETPLTLRVAREFLTEADRDRWEPTKRTVVYPDGELETAGAHRTVRVSVGSSVQLDSRGAWLGDPTGGRGVSFDLHLAREDGEWRISDAPNALILPRSHFDSRYVRYDLHFFDPTGTVLVPEPVYLPSGVQAPSLLVSGLLAGPAPALRTVERSYFPPGTKLDLSVPVSDGVAEVPLSEEILDIDDRQLDLAMAQLAWTLRQVPGLDEMRVTVDGASIDRTTGASARSLRGWSAYDPSVPSTGTDVYGLRGTAVVSVSDEVADVVTTAFRRDPIRALAVDPRGEGTVGVSSDGRRVLRAGLPAVQGRESRPRPVHNGQDVLRPAWDQFGNIWLVDRSRSGARVTVLSDGASRRLRVPGMTGQDVTAFELSRDGTRIAAVVDGQVVLARVGRQENGRPTRALRPIHIQVAGDAGRVVDLGWAAPAMLGVLTRLSPDSAQVLPAGIDGSFAVGDDATPLEPLFEAADDLVTWPGADAPVFLAAPSGRVYQASPTGRWVAAPLPPGLGALTFPG